MFDQKQVRYLVTFVGLFAATRVIFLNQLGNSPLLDFLFLDSEFYLGWARGIHAGLGDPPGPYWLSPLYSYAMAAVLGATGSTNPMMVVIAQASLSVATLVLLAMITAKLFDTTTALVATALAVLYGPWLYYDGVIVTSSLILFLNACMLWLLIFRANLLGTDPSAGDASPLWPWVAAGLICGLSALARPAILFFPTLILLSLVIGRRRRRLIPAMVLLLCALLPTVPAVYHNWHETGGSFLTTTSAGANIYIGNRLGASGSYDETPFVVSSDPIREAEAYRSEASRLSGDSLSLAHASGFWFRQSVREIAQAPGEWIVLLIKKIWLTVQGGELPNNLSFHAVADYCPIVKAMPVRWGLLFPLAMAGLYYLRSRRKQFTLLWLYAATYLLTVLVFFSSSEYRFPLVLLLIPLAAVFLVGIARAVRQKQASSVVAPSVIYVCALFIANFPSQEVDRKVSPALDYANLGTTAMDYKKYDEAIPFFARALMRNDSLREARIGMGDALWRVGSFDDARREYRLAGVPAPDSLSGAPLASVLEELWQYTEHNDYPGGLAFLDHVFPPVDSAAPNEILLQRAMVLHKLRRYDEAAGSLALAGLREPGNPDWPYKAGMMAELAGKYELADSLYTHAISKFPTYAPARLALGTLAIRLKDYETAREQLRELKQIEIPDDSLKKKMQLMEIEVSAWERQRG